MGLTVKADNSKTGDFVILDEDTYDASYQKYEEYTGQYGLSLKMFFTVAYVDDKGKVQYTDVSGIAGVPDGGLGIKSKLRTWIEALLGRPLADGESIDIASLANAPCRLFLTIKDGKTKREDGTFPKFNRVERVLPARKRTSRPAVEIVEEEAI